MKKISFIILITLLLIPSQYANARWVDFGEWFGGSDLCVNSSSYTADTCGMPVPPNSSFTPGHIPTVEDNRSYVPGPLRGQGVSCNYFFTSGACCCQGLALAPDAPANVKISASGNTITIRWAKDTSGSVEEYILRWDYDSSINVNDSRTIKLSAGKTAYTHRNLKYNTKYYYALIASGRYGQSRKNVNAKTGKDPNAPQINIVQGALYRYWNAKHGDHFYTTSPNELGSGKDGYNYEGHAGYVETSQKPGTVPLYRYVHPDTWDHFYTTNWNEIGSGKYGYKYEGVQCYVYPSQKSGTVPFYRYFNPDAGDHFYTSNWNELGSGKSGYSYEGIQCYVKAQP